MNFDGCIGFEMGATGRTVQVWQEDGAGVAISEKVTVPVSTLQSTLRSCDAKDEMTISWFSDAIIQVRSFRLQNTACVLQRLGIRQ